MGNDNRLSFGEFLNDIRLVLAAPGRRFAVIRERGAGWGSLVLLMVPAYLGFSFVGGIYFKHDPFPGYSFMLPLIAAAAAVFLKLYVIHFLARLFLGRDRARLGRGAFSGLVVVFGYTGVPAILALLLAMALFLLMPQELAYLMRNLRVLSVSIMVAIGISLFIWNLILVVLSLRTVYPMRDIKIVAAFILGSMLMLVPGFGTNWIYRSVHVDFVYAQPVFSARILRFFASDPTSNVSSGARLSIHLDRLAYHLRSPELFELVTFVRKFQKGRDSQNKPDIVMGSQTGFNWEEGDCIMGRIVGLPGDTVELVQGNLKINGRAWDERYIAPEYRSEALLPVTTLGPSEYFILPENRRLINTLKDELVVNRDRIVGRQILNRWPLGWWTFSPTVFLPPQPATQGKAP